jgi:transposase
MPTTNPPYPEAFRAEAVALVRTSGRSIPVVAGELGVSEQAVRDWMKRAYGSAVGGTAPAPRERRAG